MNRAQRRRHGFRGKLPAQFRPEIREGASFVWWPHCVRQGFRAETARSPHVTAFMAGRSVAHHLMLLADGRQCGECARSLPVDPTQACVYCGWERPEVGDAQTQEDRAGVGQAGSDPTAG